MQRAPARRALQAFLARFPRRPELGAYEAGLPRLSFPGPKRPHAVLLLHGFSASPATFDGLAIALKAANIPFYAPTLTGFGLDQFDHLEAVRGEDWRRDVLNAYHLLAELADEVSIVAHSLGTLLAAELAQAHPVKHLFLVSPYFYLRGATERRTRARLAKSAFRKLALRLAPWVAKPVRPGQELPLDLYDPEAAARVFQYPYLPLSSLLALWNYPREVDWPGLKTQTLSILWGEQDQTSDVPALLTHLASTGVPHTRHGFERSGHNLLDDFDGAAAVAAITAHLVAEAPHPVG